MIALTNDESVGGTSTYKMFDAVKCVSADILTGCNARGEVDGDTRFRISLVKLVYAFTTGEVLVGCCPCHCIFALI